MKKNVFDVYYQSDNPEEIAKEKKKTESILSLLPLTSGGSIDKTNYVLLNENKNKKNLNSSSNTTFAKRDNNIANNSNKNIGNNSINPWNIEKNFDDLQTFKLAKPSGGYHTINYPRPTYGSKENFEKLNQSKFDSVIEHSFDFEGGYANNKNDRGGETNYGITKPFLEDYKHALPGGISKPIRELTKDEARLLYKAQWDKYNLGYIRNKDLAFVLNDYMINSNAKKVAERVQGIINSNGQNLKIDGLIGEKTLNAIHNTDKEWLIDQILIDRYNWYRKVVQRDRIQIEHYRGWIKRLNDIAKKVKSKLIFSPIY